MDEMIDTSFSHIGQLRRLWLVVSAAAVGAMLVSAPAFAQQQQDEDEPVRDRGIIGSIMSGIGARDGSEDIRYRERSPLVIPPKLNLPAPEARRPEAGNWPKDPDVIERRAQQKSARERNKQLENDPSYQLDPRNNAPIAGVARARQATASAQPGARDESSSRAFQEGNMLLSPSQLQSKMDIFNLFGSKKQQQQQETFTGEPAREALTMPPPGYQTPANAGQGYTASAESRERDQRYDGTGSGILPPGKF